jgi:hypothetical protein
MLVTLSERVIKERLEQPLKASSPILVTLFGIETDVSPEQPAKAQYPMLVTLSPITTDVIDCR